MNKKNQVRLDLSLDEINQILSALGKRPYEEVFQLIAKIQAQAEEQLRAQAEQNGQMERLIVEDEQEPASG